MTRANIPSPILDCTFRIQFICAILTLSSALAQGGYPPGTLAPEVDLELQPVQLIVPDAFRGKVRDDLTLNLPPGFSASVFAHERLRKPRFMAFDDNGVLHVANMGAGEIVAFPDRDDNGVADERIRSLRGLAEAHSLLFYKGDLYVGEEHQVVRARDNDGDLIYEEREVILADVPWEGWHDTRTLVVDRINDKMYLSVGSPCDLCRMDIGFQTVGNRTDMVPQHPERGTVIQFNPDGSDRRIFATGVRNVIGMDFHPVTNELWGNNNGHDLEGRTAPPEWIDIMRDGDFMGYPLVHSHQVWNDFEIEPYQRILPITDADRTLAARHKRPVALVPAHYAPMGIHFYTGDQFPTRYKNAAFVAFRAGKAKLSSHPGYMVSALFSAPDGSNATIAPFITGFQAGTSQDDVWGFPVGIISDDDGSLYVTSDYRNNLVIKITHSPIGGSWQHDLPDKLQLGETLSFHVTVHVDRLDPAGGPPRLSADLSAFGGPGAVPLIALDDNEYELAIDLETAGLPKGLYPVAVRLEQEVGGKFQGFDFVKQISLLPPDLSVYDEEIADRWQLQGLSGATVADEIDGPLYHGGHATAVAAEPVNFYTPWAIEFRPDNPVESLGFAGVRFAFHPGDAELAKFPIFILYIDGLGIDLVRDPEKFHLDFTRREWQIMEIPFAAFSQENDYGPGLRDQIDAIDALRFEGNMTGTFYLDDVRLVSSIPSGPPTPTAVREERGAGQPGDFALSQNFPNPFNNNTTIRYALSQAAPVDLSVYNLAGQRVIQLVAGWRQAGNYTARWDGRTTRGFALSTGVYIYRLRTGDRIESRKLLLLR